jgi:anthranilate phosphoribosyltransferase
MYKTVVNKLLSSEDLKEEEAQQIMNQMMQGALTSAQIAGFLTALRIKGETLKELLGCALAMREHAVPLTKSYPQAIDTCGTGGDGKGTFNISTVTAFVVAGAGLQVAKHGNRGVSSQSGSADVLEALGINLHLTPSQVEACLEEVGIAFFFAPVFHPAMKFAVIPRRELGFRTIFNLLGPLTNPAGVRYQVLGVYDPTLTETIAETLKELGVQQAMVVCSERGMDEITLTEDTKISQVKNGKVSTFYLQPETLGLTRCGLENIQGGDARRNARISREILEGKRKDAMRDTVLVNSAAALMIGGIAENLPIGISMAAESIDSEAALQKLKELRDFSLREVTV